MIGSGDREMNWSQCWGTQMGNQTRRVKDYKVSLRVSTGCLSKVLRRGRGAGT